MIFPAQSHVVALLRHQRRTLTFFALTSIARSALPLPVLLLARRTVRRSMTVRRTGYVLLDAVRQVMKGIRVIKA